MTAEFTHCALHARDLDASIAFYESYCGLRIVKEHGARPRPHGVDGRTGMKRRTSSWCCSAAGRSVRKSKDDMTHYGFAVPSRADVEAIAERGRKEGRLFWEPQEFPPPTGYLCAVTDPSGYVDRVLVRPAARLGVR